MFRQEQYGSLTNKTLAFLQLVTRLYEPQYIVKADDDVYLRVDRIPIAVKQWSVLQSGNTEPDCIVMGLPNQTLCTQALIAYSTKVQRCAPACASKKVFTHVVVDYPHFGCMIHVHHNLCMYITIYACTSQSCLLLWSLAPSTQAQATSTW